MVTGTAIPRLHSALIRFSLVLAVPVVLAGCFLLVTPFPAYMGGVEYVLDLTGLAQYTGIAGREEKGTRYDLAVIGTGASMRLLLKVEPPSSVGGGFDYRGRIIVFDEYLAPLGVIAPDSTLDYLSRPYAYTHNAGEILIGYSVFNDSTYVFDEKVSQHGLTGFAVSQTGVSTHLFSTPSGAFSGFNLEIRNYIANNPWGVSPDQTSVNIIPPSEWPPFDDPDFTRLGYQLLGVYYQELPSDEITFLLSRPSRQHIVAARVTLADVLSGMTTELLPSEADPGFNRIDGVDRPGASVDAQGFFLLQRDGWFARYTWDPGSGAVPGPRVVGDTSFDRRYAFYAEGSVFYRFDPAALTLTRIRGWW